MPSSPGIGMHVEVKDPDDKIVLSRVSLHALKSMINVLILFVVWENYGMRMGDGEVLSIITSN